MLPTSSLYYEFGGFVLNARDRRLSHFNRRINLSGKDFDLLEFLVRNANTLIPSDDLIETVWGTEASIHRGNLTNHIAKVRKALGCDPRRPTFIRTVHGKNSYVFIAPVKPTTSAPIADSELRGDDGLSNLAAQFHVTSHVFVPVYLGTELFSEIKGPVIETQWLKYREYKVDNTRLCVLPSGVAVWDIRYASSFATLSDAATWRKELYEQIFEKRTHFLNVCTSEFAAGSSSERQGLFQSVLGTPGYAYSLMVLQSAERMSMEKIRRIMEVLACPRALEPKNSSKGERERIRALERNFLENGMNSSDMREFGMAGDDLGFASWEGVSYFNSAGNADEQLVVLIEFQIAVHALWWLSKCLASIWLSDPYSAGSRLSKTIPEIKRQFLIVKNIEAKESTSQRTMEEAVLSVNRVAQIVAETIELYS